MADLRPVQYLFQLWELLVWWMDGQDWLWVRALSIFRAQNITASHRAGAAPFSVQQAGRTRGGLGRDFCSRPFVPSLGPLVSSYPWASRGSGKPFLLSPAGLSCCAGLPASEGIDLGDANEEADCQRQTVSPTPTHGPTAQRTQEFSMSPAVASSAGGRQEARHSLGKAGKQISGRRWSEKGLPRPPPRPWGAGAP